MILIDALVIKLYSKENSITQRNKSKFNSVKCNSIEPFGVYSIYSIFEKGSYNY
jgi:hypothetical protein